MANRNFSTWLSGFRDSIADYGYYIDFEKVHRNVDCIKVNITTLIISKKPGNTGISRDIRTEFTTDLLLSD